MLERVSDSLGFFCLGLVLAGVLPLEFQILCMVVSLILAACTLRRAWQALWRTKRRLAAAVLALEKAKATQPQTNKPNLCQPIAIVAHPQNN